MHILKKKKAEKKEEEINQSQIGLEVNKQIFQPNIWKLYLFQFFIGFHMMTGILMPFFLDWGGLTFFEVMMLQGFFTFMILVFEIPCGAVSDYLSRKLSLCLSGLIIALAVLIYGSTPNIFIFAIGEALWGFGVALISGTDQAIVYDTLRKLDRTEDMKKIMARIQSMMLIGLTTAAPVGSLLTLILPLPRIVQLTFIPFIIATFIAITIKEPNHDLERKSEKYIEVIKSGFTLLKNNRVLQTLSLDMLLADILIFYLIWMYQLYLDDLSVPLFFFGFIATSMTLSQILFTIVVPKLEKRFSNKKRFLQIYTLIPGVGFILMALIHFAPISIVLILIVIGFGMSRNIIFVSAINKNIETENRATVISTISMMVCIVRSVTYPIVGLLVTWNLNYTFIILGIAMISLVLISFVKNEDLN